MRSRLPSMVLALLAGCAVGEDDLLPSPAKFVQADDVDGYEALSSSGVVPHRATVRAVNGFGAAVSGDPTTTFRVGAAPVEVAFDGLGYGAIEITTAGRTLIEGGAAPATIDTVATAWPGVALHPAWEAPILDPELGFAVTTGTVAMLGEEIWWQGEGAPSHRVLVADGPLLGMVADHVDVDGVTDVVAWTSQTVFLLRGRGGGGFGWGGALTATGHSVAGADVGDLSSDNLPDLAIAWVSSDGEGVLDVWEGDGLFRFVPAEPRDIPGRPIGLQIGDNTSEGVPQITVLDDAGGWSRFIRGTELRYMPIGPSAPTSVVLPREAVLLPTGDINGDEADEIPVASLRTPGVGRTFWLFDVKTDPDGCLAGDPAAQCTTQYLPLENEIGAWAVLEDGNGDRVDDMWLLGDDRELVAVAYDPLAIDGRYRKMSMLSMPGYGPFDLEDFDTDGGQDVLLMGGPVWWRWRGVSHGDLDLFWSPVVYPTQQVREALEPPWAMAELDSDPNTVEIVGFQTENGDTLLRVVQYTVGGGRAPVIGDVEVNDAGLAVDDLVVCGADAWLVVGGEVVRVAINDPTTPIVGGREGTTASRVDCGVGPNGADAAMLEGAEVKLLERVGVAVTETVPAPGARDLAIGDLGDGPMVETCTTEGCSIVAWTWGAAGETVFAKGDDTGIVTVDRAGVETPIGGAGQLSVGDLDADGHLDLVGRSGPHDLVTLHRSTGVSIAPAEFLHAGLGWTGALGVRDGDGDGWPDLWALDSEGDLTYTVPPSALDVSTPTGTTTGTGTGTGTDTGDTGTP